MSEIVVIVGGGVAGLTAAHELIERGFEVHIYERRSFYGGKAASRRDASERPGEHGFRFYPGWYRHLPDTLSRIRYRGSRAYQEAKSVLDNLVPIESEVLAWYERDPITLLTHVPKTLGEAKTAGAFVRELAKLGLAPGEFVFFAHRMAQFLLTPDARRAEIYEGLTWWDYLEADTKSQAYQDLISATTRLMVAAKAKDASAYTIGRLALRTFSDALATIDRVMDGPTNEVWIEPWIDQLKGLGVHFHPGWELDAIEFAEPTGNDSTSLTNIVALRFANTVLQQLQLAQTLLDDIATYLVRTDARWPQPAHDEVELRRCVADCRALVQAVRADPEWREHTDAPDGGGHVDEIDADLSRIEPLLEAALDPAIWGPRSDPAGCPPVRPESLAKTVADLRELAGKLEPIGAHGTQRFKRTDRREGRYFVFALPVEQMAYYVNRCAALTLHDPSLRNIVLLSEYTDWMAGIQFYLKEPFDYVAGHIVCLDSQWGLTAIEQTQFWRDTPLKVKATPAGRDIELRAVLSVDIAAWDTRGRFVRLEAFNCKSDEIATEVWNELKASLNRRDQVQRLRDDMLVGGPKLQKGVNYHLDDNVADVYDRKKQAAYENARSVEFSSEEIVRRQRDSGREMQPPFMWGAHREFNAEPLLINRVGSLALRPEAQTRIPNMFLAADYVRTETNLACMEGANEAARRAVNALLDASSSLRPRCQIWPLSPARDVLEHLTGLATSGPVRSVAARAAKTAGQVTDGLAGFASQAFANLRAMRSPNGRP